MSGARSQRAPIANIYTRFLRRVSGHGFDPASCWEWHGAGKGNGYGNVSIGGVNISAHRLAYELFCGPVPADMDVCHSCDTRYCVNPDHLFLGTRKQNMADCRSKGRSANSVRRHLSEATVQEIRRRLACGLPPRRVADDLDVNYGTVTAIQSERSYVGIGK